MSDLQTAYYVVGIVFMGVIFLLLIGLLVVALVIRAKINAIHARIEEKLEQVTSAAAKGAAVVGSIRKIVDKKKR